MIDYDDLMKKALRGESVNAAAKRMGLRQRQLDYYVKGQNLPGCDVAIVIAESANVSIEDAVRAIASKKAALRPESVSSFLRPAVASVLTLVLSVFMLWSPPPSTYASERIIHAEQVQNRPSPPVFTGLVPEEKSPRKRAFSFGWRGNSRLSSRYRRFRQSAGWQGSALRRQKGFALPRVLAYIFIRIPDVCFDKRALHARGFPVPVDH